MNDTAFGINNEGGLVFDYYHEDSDQVDGANVYNGQLSTLWVNFKQAFPDLIQETYQDLRSNSVLNYDELIDQFITHGSDKWSESVYNEDGDFKYISMLRTDNDATNLPQIRGTGEEHLRYFIENRLNYCDSKWYAGDYPEDNAVVRIYTPVDTNGVPLTNLTIPANANITVTPYSNMYAGVRYKANGTLMQERLEANETYTFVAPNETFNDTETAIYGASQLSSLGDLAPLYLGYIDVGAATKLVELKIGDGTPGYKNANLYHLAVGTNRLLKKIDIQNCDSPRFVQALVLSGCPNIEEVYAKGSSITGVELPDSGYLKILQLPSTITNLTLKNQFYIEDLTIEGYDRLKTITIENCPDIDSLSILDLAINVERVRLTNVDWHYDDASILYELIDRNIGGIDENGTNTDTMWIDGKCHIETLTGNELAEIKRLYPYLEITYTTLTSQLIYMTLKGGEHDNWVESYRETIYNGGNGSINILDNYDNLIDISKCTSEGIAPDGVATAENKLFTPFIEVTHSKYYYNIFPTLPSGEKEWNQKIYMYDSSKNYICNFQFSSNSNNVVDLSLDAYAACKYVRIMFSTEWTNPYFGLSEEIPDGIPTPTKASTAQYHFTFNGWSLEPNGLANLNALLNVEADRYVYAAFKNEIRSYTVNFYSGTKLLYSTVVEYGSDATYIGSTPTNDSTGNIADFEFTGWNPAPTNIQGDTNCYAQFYDTREILDDWATIAQACSDGTATSKYAIGAYKTLDIGAIELPYDFYEGSAVVYNGEIHILGSAINNYRKSHYKWNGSEWVSVSTLPYSFYSGDAVVLNGEIHICGGGYGNGEQNAHYKWNGTEWVSVSTLPYLSGAGRIVLCNDELHILGSNNTDCQNAHYKWNGTEWTSVSTLPYPFYGGDLIVLNGEIHICGSRNSSSYKSHYKWNGTEWVSVSTLPYPVYSGDAIVLNGEIHICGSEHGNHRKSHYKWNGSEWVSASTLPYYFHKGRIVVYDGFLHILGSSDAYSYRKHYMFDGTSKWNAFGTTESIPMQIVAHNHDELADGARKWELVDTLPAIFVGGSAVILNNEVHIIGGQYSSKIHYKWDGTTWTKLDDIPEFGSAVALNGSIYLKSINTLYSWDGTMWNEVCALPYPSSQIIIVFNNELHILGANTSDAKKHYKWDGTSWIEVSTLPFQHYGRTPVVVYDGSIHLMSSPSSADNRKHYKWDGTSWTEVSTLPTSGSLLNTPGIVYDDEIHIFNGTAHYKWNGSEWTIADDIPLAGKDSTVPYPFVVYNNELHQFGGGTSLAASKQHWKWSGSSWVEQPYMFKPYNNISCCVIYNNELHIIGGYSNSTGHYKTDGVTKTEVGTTPISFTGGNAVLFNNEIHTFVSSNHYKWDEANGWSVASTMPTEFSGTPKVVVHDGKIHALYSNYHYAWDGTTWILVSTIKRSANSCAFFTFNSELYSIITVGGSIYEFRKLNGSEWVDIEYSTTLTANIGFGAVKNFVEYNGVVYFGFNSDIFSFDGVNLSLCTASASVSGMGVIYNHLVYWSGYYLYRYENPRATLTFLAGNALKDDRKMHSFNMNRNFDYSATDLRNWLNNNLFDSFPTELQNSIQEVIKLTGKQSGIAKSNEKCWLISDEETGVNMIFSHLGEGEAYDVFTNNTSRIRTKTDGIAVQYFIRSYYIENNGRTGSVLNNGSILHNINMDSDLAVVFGFCI